MGCLMEAVLCVNIMCSSGGRGGVCASCAHCMCAFHFIRVCVCVWGGGACVCVHACMCVFVRFYGNILLSSLT